MVNLHPRIMRASHVCCLMIHLFICERDFLRGFLVFSRAGPCICTKTAELFVQLKQFYPCNVSVFLPRICSKLPRLLVVRPDVLSKVPGSKGLH